MKEGYISSEDYALSNADISHLLKGKINIFTYPQLAQFNTIDDILYPYGQAIILYLSKPNFGHWISVIKYPHSNTVEVFDSYGQIDGKVLYPDDELKWISKSKRKQLGENYPYLTRLLLNSPYNIEFNPHKLQSTKNNISTCGKWAVLRVLFKNLNNDQFNDLFRGIKNKDKVVSQIIDDLYFN